MSVPIKPRNRTKTAHDIANTDEEVIDDKKSEVKTANLITSEH